MALKNKVVSIKTKQDIGEEIELQSPKIDKNTLYTVRALLKALECKDSYTFLHSTRVAFYCLVLGKEYGLNQEQLLELELCGLLHDIGKIGIPEQILNKPYGLDEEEFQLMKRHPEFSAEIVASYPALSKIVEHVRHHHERFDGRGYPTRLKGESIPLYARMILIADTYDAMTSTRPYREGLSSTIAYKELLELSGSQFDPKLVQSFIRGMRAIEQAPETTYYISTLEQEFDRKAA